MKGKNKNPVLIQVTEEIKLQHVYSNASDLIKELTELMDKHGDCGIHLNAFDDFGCPSADLTFSYKRPENTEEAKKRKSDQAQREAWDRQHWERLNKKYGK